jgi:DNA invertase Pin-like site-specific DNA recombinase
MILGYARVSTADQDLAGQLESLKAAGAERVFQEKISGARSDRPMLAECLANLQRGDTLLVTRLDRLARSTLDLLGILKRVDEIGATFKSLADPWANTDSALGKLVITLLGSIAEFERSLILARTSAGRERARAAGRRIGGPQPKLSAAQRDAARERLAAGERASVVGRELGVSTDTIRRLRKLA